VIDRRAAAALVQEMACLEVMTTPQRNKRQLEDSSRKRKKVILYLFIANRSIAWEEKASFSDEENTRANVALHLIG